MWGIAVDGNATVDGFKSDIEASIDDLLEELNVAVMGQFEARKGRFGAFVNPVFAELTSKNSQGQASVKSTGTLFETDFAAYCRVGDWHLGDGALDAAPKVAVEPDVGGRLWYLDAELEADRLGSADKGQGIGRSHRRRACPVGYHTQVEHCSPGRCRRIRRLVRPRLASDGPRWLPVRPFADDDADLLVG